MKKLTQEQINKILEGHRHWINEDCEGWETMRADFSYCELSHTDLSHTDLSYAHLNCANLCGANLRYANLSYANLSHTDLSYANLSDAYLIHTDLIYVNLHDAYLHDAYLNDANLNGANLHGANLSYAHLNGADLCDANLSYANLSYADLSDVDLSYAKEVPYIPMVCPEEGEFIGWKKASGKIVKLRIPEDALRSSSTTRKCRCNKAEVIEIYNIDGTIADERIVKSSYNSSFTYEVGKTVEVQDFDTNRWEECTRGIHFFINRQEAINYWCGEQNDEVEDVLLIREDYKEWREPLDFFSNEFIYYELNKKGKKQ